MFEFVDVAIVCLIRYDGLPSTNIAFYHFDILWNQTIVIYPVILCNKCYQWIQQESARREAIGKLDFESLNLPVIYLIRDHYNDVIMRAMASHITRVSIVYSTVGSDGDQRKHQSSASLAFVPRAQGQ